MRPGILPNDEIIGRLRGLIEDSSTLIVEHRAYRERRPTHRFLCTDLDELDAYVRHQAEPGDEIYLWRFEDCCREDNVAAAGEIPNEDS